MRSRFLSLHLDFLGFSASMLCALHCLSLPFLLSISTMGSLQWLDNFGVELVFISVSFVIASWSLGQSYFMQHKKLDALLVVIIGFVLILISRFVVDSAEVIFTTLGGLLVAVAHFVNWKLSKTCTLRQISY
ncbi:MAG: MerC domain-containing protein [Saprospiraceae bacterium]|nr:MerC domain-containing protein [Saprospiraceae bacterium]